MTRKETLERAAECVCARLGRLRQHGEVRLRDVHGLFRIIECERAFDMV